MHLFVYFFVRFLNFAILDLEKSSSPHTKIPSKLSSYNIKLILTNLQLVYYYDEFIVRGY